MENKICSRCMLEKNISEFGKHKRSKDGLRYECNTCRSLESKKYRESNTTKIAEIRKKSYEINKEKALNRTKLWRNSNPDKAKEGVNQWRLNNEEKHKFYMKIWRTENRTLINNYVKIRNQSNPLFKLMSNCRSRVSRILFVNNIRKKNKTSEIIGCSKEFLKEHLEKQFTNGMTWDNYGLYGWHIDHIIPLSSAKTEDEIYKLCHYTNLQPLWWFDNLKKGNKLYYTYNKV